MQQMDSTCNSHKKECLRTRRRRLISAPRSQMALKFALPLLTIALFALTTVHHQRHQQALQMAEARSFLGNIPGMDLMKDLTNEIMGQVGRVLDNEISSGPAGALVAECLGRASENCGPPPDPDAKRTVKQIIESRGFQAEEYDVVTGDGYILTIQRIINPLVDAAQRQQLKPVILQHGLLSSSVDWVLSSVYVKPVKPVSKFDNRPNGGERQNEEFDLNNEIAPDYYAPANSSNSIEGHHQASTSNEKKPGPDTQEHPNSLGFYLANEGYDVFLANSRGNVYGSRHINMSSWQPKFWSFTFDEQIAYDLPDIIAYIQRLTDKTKVGYVGHSQGTTMIFGLLADKPEYANIIEPIVALAPVAYVGHVISPVKYFSIYTPIFQNINMWFGSSNVAVRYLAPIVCGPEVIRKDVCANIIFLSTGFDEAEFDMERASAYLAHMPSGTSVKNIAHWGQEVNSGRFAHFDHGILANQMRYGTPRAPDYDITKIRSKSIALFTAENDWLASPKDVARLKAELRVPFEAFNISKLNPKWNHIDFVTGLDTGKFVNKQIVEFFHKYD